MPLMAALAITEINVNELDLIQSIQTAAKAFEARNPTLQVEELTYNFKAGGIIQYEVKFKDMSSPTPTKA